MSVFDNKTKPELEAGNYIAYTDEPDTIVSAGGGGGESYDVKLISVLTSGQVSEYTTFAFFSINGEPVTGFAEKVEPDNPYWYEKTVTVSQGDIFALGEIEGYIVDNLEGAYTLPIPSGEVNTFPSKKVAEYFAQISEMEIPTVIATYEDSQG